MAPFCGGFHFNQDGEGYVTLRLPRWGGTNEIPFVSVTEDFGEIVHGVLLNPAKYLGKVIQAFSVSAKPEELVAVFEKGESPRGCKIHCLDADPAQVIGKKSRFVPVEGWRTMETYGAKEYITIRDMFRFPGALFRRPNDSTDARQLKAAAAEAKRKDGVGNSTSLATLESFVAKYFTAR